MIVKGDINFVIITQPRSGSYYFQSLLNSANDIVCHGEIFKSEWVELSEWHRNKLGIGASDVTKRNEAPYQFLMNVRKLNPHKIFGFKAFWQHLSPHNALVQNVIRAESWKKIFLVRNPIETYASLQRAKMTNLWLQTKSTVQIEELNKNRPVVDFDPESFERHLKDYFWFLSQCRNLADSQINSCYQIGYQDALDAAKQQDVLSFLGSSSDSASLKSNYVRQYSGSMQDSFANWDAMLDYLDKINLTYIAFDGIDVCEDRGDLV